MQLIKKLTFMLTAVTVSTNLAIAQDVMPDEEDIKPPKKEYSPFVDDHFPIRPLFGDTHLHTSWSADAGMLGGTLGPASSRNRLQQCRVARNACWDVEYCEIVLCYELLTAIVALSDRPEIAPLIERFYAGE